MLSRSFKVIYVDIPKKLVASDVMISSMSVPICNHFHVRRANNGRMTLFKGEGAPYSPPCSREVSSLSGMKFCHEILETLSYHAVETISLYLTFISIPGCVRQTQDTKTKLP